MQLSINYLLKIETIVSPTPPPGIHECCLSASQVHRPYCYSVRFLLQELLSELATQNAKAEERLSLADSQLLTAIIQRNAADLVLIADNAERMEECQVHTQWSDDIHWCQLLLLLLLLLQTARYSSSVTVKDRIYRRARRVFNSTRLWVCALCGRTASRHSRLATMRRCARTISMRVSHGSRRTSVLGSLTAAQWHEIIAPISICRPKYYARLMVATDQQCSIFS